jgi:hypothetical protein
MESFAQSLRKKGGVLARSRSEYLLVSCPKSNMNKRVPTAE